MPHESGLAQGVASARSSMDETLETFQHPPSGDTGKPQGHSQQAPGVLGRVSLVLALIFTMR